MKRMKMGFTVAIRWIYERYKQSVDTFDVASTWLRTPTRSIKYIRCGLFRVSRADDAITRPTIRQPPKFLIRNANSISRRHGFFGKLFELLADPVSTAFYFFLSPFTSP